MKHRVSTEAVQCTNDCHTGYLPMSLFKWDWFLFVVLLPRPGFRMGSMLESCVSTCQNIGVTHIRCQTLVLRAFILSGHRRWWLCDGIRRWYLVLYVKTLGLWYDWHTRPCEMALVHLMQWFRTSTPICVYSGSVLRSSDELRLAIGHYRTCAIESPVSVCI